MARRAETCTACQRVFDVGETFQAFLYETPEGYARRDYCRACSPAAAQEAIGSWRTRRPDLSAKKAVPFDREAIYAFFERLEATDDPQRRQFRFVLALLLWRKKVLRLDQTVAEPAGEVWEFAAARSGTTFRVPRSELDEEQLEGLSAQLEQLLATGPAELEIISPTEMQEGGGD
jgi:hypothetical protein